MKTTRATMTHPVRHLKEREARPEYPEFKGRVFTGLEPLDNDQRLCLFRVKLAINDFFKPEPSKGRHDVRK